MFTCANMFKWINLYCVRCIFTLACGWTGNSGARCISIPELRCYDKFLSNMFDHLVEIMATPFNRIAQVVRHPAAICRGKVFINGKVLVSNSPSSQLYTIVPPIVRSWTWVFRWAAMLVFRDEWDSWGLWIFATWLELSIFLGLESLISHPPSTCASWQVLRVIAPATFDIGATGLCCSLVGTFEVPMIGRPKANARFFLAKQQ